MRKSFIFIAFILILSMAIMPIHAAEWGTLSPIDDVTPNVNEAAADKIIPEDSGTLSPTDSTNTDNIHVQGSDSLIQDSEAQIIYDSYIDTIPNVTTDDLLQWATTKGNEIIYLLQVIVQPVTIIIFIIAAFMAAIGSIGKGDMVGKGMWGMICSILVYAAVLYAPVILQTFVGWIVS